MERAKGIESDFTSFSDWTANAGSETHLEQIAPQPCQRQGVAEMPNVGTLTPASVSMPDQNASENRTLTEQQQNTGGVACALGSLLPELLVVWPKVPEAVKTGILAMIQAAIMAAQDE